MGCNIFDNISYIYFCFKKALNTGHIILNLKSLGNDADNGPLEKEVNIFVIKNFNL